MNTEIPAAKNPNLVAGRTVEITDEDENLVFTFVPLPTPSPPSNK
jgi:hypothetical protein